jgi:cystathionine beta-lyase
MHPFQRDGSGSMLAVDPDSIERLFGGAEDVLALWIAEPYVPVAPEIVAAVSARAAEGWYGYETRPEQVLSAFWGWMNRRHRWSRTGLEPSVSPSVGTSIGALIEVFTEPGDGVILQPPVFTDFKPLVRRQQREPVRNSLVLSDGRYTMDVEGLADVTSAPENKVMILCNPHNPVGRAWSAAELGLVAEICSANDVLVISDEIHADLVLPPFRFTPFASAIHDSGVRWAATHGPIKTFGIAGLADTLLITDDLDITRRFRSLSNRMHLTRNNVLALAATEAAYAHGDEWVDRLLDLVATNLRTLDEGLPEGIDLIASEATYLAWLDFRQLGIDVPGLSLWLSADAGLALSPGHWFGREGAGFARMSIAVDGAVVDEAVGRLRSAVGKI